MTCSHRFEFTKESPFNFQIKRGHMQEGKTELWKCIWCEAVKRVEIYVPKGSELVVTTIEEKE